MHRACAGKLFKLPWDTHGIQLYTYIPQFHCNPFRHVSQEQIERKNAQFFVLKAGMSQEKGCLSGGPLGGREAGKGGRDGRQRREAMEGGRGKEAGGRRPGRRGEREAGARAPHVGSQKKPRQKAFAARCEAFCRGVWCGAARLRPDAADVRKKRERSSATALPPP